MPNFRQAHRLLVDDSDAAGAVAIVEGLSVVGFERGLMELADWCDATVAMVTGRNDALELAAVASAARFWWLQTRVDDIAAAADRLSAVDGQHEHHLVLEDHAVQATLDPARWAEAIDRLRTALERHGSNEPTWASAEVAVYLLLLGGLQDADLTPMVERLGSPVLAARLAFYRGVPH